MRLGCSGGTFRYIVIVHPLKAYFVNRRHIIQIICGLWLFSAFLNSPQLLYYRLIANGSDESLHGCDNINTGTRTWYIYESVLLIQVHTHSMGSIAFSPMFKAPSSALLPPRDNSVRALHEDLSCAVEDGRDVTQE
jgi:hypothetical protein